jgi:integrase
LVSTEGTPWTSDGFRASWGKACKLAGIVGVTFHDLRGTAVTRLALAGCTEAEIATITGSSPCAPTIDIALLFSPSQ